MPRIQDLSSFRLSPGARGRPAYFVQLWWIVQGVFFHTSPQVLYGWRCFLLRLFGAKIGRNVILRPSVNVTYPWKLIIGDNVWVGDDVGLYNLDTITIGHDAVVSQGSYLCTGTHDYTTPSFPLYTKPIVIEPEVWVSSHVFVGPGVTIGQGTVVGARSLVLKDLPPMVKAVGHPAVITGPRVMKPV